MIGNWIIDWRVLLLMGCPVGSCASGPRGVAVGILTTTTLLTTTTMTSSDHNNFSDLVTSQEKLEWVTPQISLMDAEDTEGKANYAQEQGTVNFNRGPS